MAERLTALAALVGVIAAFGLCVWVLIKLGTWIVVQFYGDHLGIEQRRVFAKPQAKPSIGQASETSASTDSESTRLGEKNLAPRSNRCNEEPKFPPPT